MRSKAKAYQVKQVRSVILKYKLGETDVAEALGRPVPLPTAA